MEAKIESQQLVSFNNRPIETGFLLFVNSPPFFAIVKHKRPKNIRKRTTQRHLIFHFSSAHDWNFSAFDASGKSSNNNNKKEKAEIRGYLNDSFQSCFRPIATGKRAKRGISCLEVSTATGVRNPLQPKHRPRLDDLNESGIFSLFLFIFQVICWCVLLFSLKSRANCYC